MSARFEIVRTDAGWHARLRAANGKTIWSTEVYTRRTTALNAIHTTARVMSPTARIWTPGTTTIAGKPAGSTIKFGHPGDDYATAHTIEVRDVDERTPKGEPVELVAEEPFYRYADDLMLHDRDYHWRFCYGDECTVVTPQPGDKIKVRLGTITYAGGGA